MEYSDNPDEKEASQQHSATSAAPANRRRLAAQNRTSAATSGPIGDNTNLQPPTAGSSKETLRERRLKSRRAGGENATDDATLKIDAPQGSGTGTPLGGTAESKPALLIDAEDTKASKSIALPKIGGFPLIQDPSRVSVLHSTAASEFSKVHAGPETAVSRAAPVNVFEESVATGAFRKVSAAATMHIRDVDAAPQGASAPGVEDEEALSDPTLNIGAQLSDSVTWLWTYAQGLLTGLCFCLVLIIQQYPNAAEGTKALSAYVNPIRFATYVFATLAWLEAGDTFVRYRAARQGILSGAIMPQKVQMLLANGTYVWLTLLSQTVVLATVFASLPLDNYIRLRADASLADLGSSGVETDYKAWHGLLWTRCAFTLIAFLSRTLTWKAPHQIDAIISKHAMLPR